MSNNANRIAEIRARLAAATPGSWYTVPIPAEESELAIPDGSERVEHVDLFHAYVALRRPGVITGPSPEIGENVFIADLSEVEQENVACLVHVNEDDPNVALIRNAPGDLAFLLAILSKQAT